MIRHPVHRSFPGAISRPNPVGPPRCASGGGAKHHVAIDQKFDAIQGEINNLDSIYRLRQSPIPATMTKVLERFPNASGTILIALPALLAQDYPVGGARREPETTYARHFHTLDLPLGAASHGLCARVKPLRFFLIDHFFETEPQSMRHIMLDLEHEGPYDRVLGLPVLAERLSDLDPARSSFAHHAKQRLPDFHRRLLQKPFFPVLFDALTNCLVRPLGDQWDGAAGESARHLMQDLSAFEDYIDLAWSLLPVWVLHYQVMRATKKFGADELNEHAAALTPLMHDVEEAVFLPLRKSGQKFKPFDQDSGGKVVTRVQDALDFWRYSFRNLDAYARG